MSHYQEPRINIPHAGNRGLQVRHTRHIPHAGNRGLPIQPDPPTRDMNIPHAGSRGLPVVPDPPMLPSPLAGSTNPIFNVPHRASPFDPHPDLHPPPMQSFIPHNGQAVPLNAFGSLGHAYGFEIPHTENLSEAYRLRGEHIKPTPHMPPCVVPDYEGEVVRKHARQQCLPVLPISTVNTTASVRNLDNVDYYNTQGCEFVYTDPEKELPSVEKLAMSRRDAGGARPYDGFDYDLRVA